MKSIKFDEKAKYFIDPKGKAAPVWSVRVKLPDGTIAHITAWEPDEADQLLLGAGDPVYLMVVDPNLPYLHVTTEKPKFEDKKPRVIKPGDADFRFIPSRLLK
jgi:hypothetical protein